MSHPINDQLLEQLAEEIDEEFPYLSSWEKDKLVQERFWNMSDDWTDKAANDAVDEAKGN